jgi:hypothetical protein
MFIRDRYLVSLRMALRKKRTVKSSQRFSLLTPSNDTFPSKARVMNRGKEVGSLGRDPPAESFAENTLVMLGT